MAKRIEGIGRVKAVGTECIGMMAWESPYIVFDFYHSENDPNPAFELIWHTEDAERLFYKLSGISPQRGYDCWFDIDCFVRPNGNGNARVWRMKKLEYR